MSWSSRRHVLLGGVALAGLSSCGFQPIYGQGQTARAINGKIVVDQIKGAMGFEMRKRLTERLGNSTAPRFGLAVSIEVASEGLAISEQNDITRYNLTGEADFALRSITTNDSLQRGTVRAFAAYSATNSPFAAQVAEDDARARLATTLADRIVTRLIASADDWAQ